MSPECVSFPLPIQNLGADFFLLMRVLSEVSSFAFPASFVLLISFIFLFFNEPNLEFS